MTRARSIVELILLRLQTDLIVPSGNMQSLRVLDGSLQEHHGAIAFFDLQVWMAIAVLPDDDKLSSSLCGGAPHASCLSRACA